MMRILAVSGTRADWGLLAPVLSLIKQDPDLELLLAVTGQHLIAGSTSLTEIGRDGFSIDFKIDIDLTSDNQLAVTHAMAEALSGIGDVLATAKPDLMLVLGDRYEIQAAVTAALIAKVPVAHMCGGDLTEGAMDDALRHSITKMAHLHFVTNEIAARRVAQLGETPANIYNVGSPGIDRIREIPVVDRTEFFQKVGLTPRKHNLLVVFHPISLADDSVEQCQAMLDALSELDDAGLIVSGANADPDNLAINEMLQTFAAHRANAVFHQSLGSQLYFSAMAHVDAMVGNSSSGLCEAPSFGLPVVNVGDRQKGRPRSELVFDCKAGIPDIAAAITRALEAPRTHVDNPYGDGHSAPRIVSAIKEIEILRSLIIKRFEDL